MMKSGVKRKEVVVGGNMADGMFMKDPPTLQGTSLVLT